MLQLQLSWYHNKGRSFKIMFKNSWEENHILWHKLLSNTEPLLIVNNEYINKYLKTFVFQIKCGATQQTETCRRKKT